MQNDQGPYTFVLGDSQQDNPYFLDALASLVDGSIITAAKSGYSTDKILLFLDDLLSELVSEGRAIYPTKWILSCSNDTATDTTALPVPLTFSNPLPVYLSNMAAIVHRIHAFCREHNTIAEILLIPPVPMDHMTLWHANVSKGADNSRTVRYAYGLGALARRLHVYYKDGRGAGAGVRGVRFANCWDAMTKAMRSPREGGPLYADGFHMTAAGYEVVAQSWKEANFFDGRTQVMEDIPVEVGRLNAWLPSAARLRYLQRAHPDKPANAMRQGYGPQPSDLFLALNESVSATYLAELCRRAYFVYYDDAMPCNNDPPLLLREWQKGYADEYEEVNRQVEDAQIGYVDKQQGHRRRRNRPHRLNLRESARYGSDSYSDAGEVVPASGGLSAAVSSFGKAMSPRLGVRMQAR